MIDTPRKNNWLIDYRKQITSQNGEDGVFEKIFEIIGEGQKWCVEFGAGSGKKGNNTWNLIANNGWNAVLIEGERALYGDMRKYYSGNNRVTCVNAFVSDTGERSLDSILKKTQIPQTFDLLSIDIDGYDYHVWKAISLYHPRVVVIEINPNIPIDLDFVQPRDLEACGGSSLLSITKLAKEKGYELIYTFGVNAIYVSKELFSQFGIVDNSPTSLNNETGNNAERRHFFQFYDGSIVLIGEPRKKILAYRKNVKQSPVWVYEEGKLYPINFSYEWRLARFVKNILKQSAIYSWLYPIFKRFYGLIDARKRKAIS